MTESMQTPDRSKLAYRQPQPIGMLPDVFLPGALDLDAEERLWVPQAEGIRFRPLLLAPSQGYYVNLLRVRNSGVLSRHRPMRGRSTPSRCAAAGAISSTSGRPFPAATPSSRPARRTRLSCRTT